MLSAGDCKKGTKILYKSEPHIVLDYQHVKPGKGGAFVRLKVKNLITQLHQDVTFRTEERLEQPDLEYREIQYLYEEEGTYHFMDQEDFEQVSLSKGQVEDISKYLKEQMVYTVLYWNDRPISINPSIIWNWKLLKRHRVCVVTRRKVRGVSRPRWKQVW